MMFIVLIYITIFSFRGDQAMHLKVCMVIQISFYCSHFKSFMLIGPFKISADNYHAVDNSALCVNNTARVVGSCGVIRA